MGANCPWKVKFLKLVEDEKIVYATTSYEAEDIAKSDGDVSCVISVEFDVEP